MAVLSVPRSNELGRRLTRATGIDKFLLKDVDVESLHYLVNISVKAHWFAGVVLLTMLLYRPQFTPFQYASYWILLTLFVSYASYIYFRLQTRRQLYWPWLQGLYILDVALLSAAVAIGGGFQHEYLHLFYYPALAGFAAIFTSFRLNMIWATLVSILYITISITVENGLSMLDLDEKTLLARIIIMYLVAAMVAFAARLERLRRQRSLERERYEISQTIHDTAAQSAAMIALGLDRALALSGNSNQRLNHVLDETRQLCRSTVWDLRHPIDAGGLYAGRTLARTLRSHVSSFNNISGVPASVTVTGAEPDLHTETKTLLFAIAHNALSNAYHHSGADQVEIHLGFRSHEIQLTIMDNGHGLPADYRDTGNGFANMQSDADRLGGTLIIDSTGPLGGASVTCIAPEARPH